MKHILIDPVSPHYMKNKLFDLNDPFLNRDNTLEPGTRLHQELMVLGIQMHTIDIAIERGMRGNYWNMGNLESPYLNSKYHDYFDTRNLILFEPPVVKPLTYKKLPKYINFFDFIHVHSPDIVAPYLDIKFASKIREFRWPIASFNPELCDFSNSRSKLLCCVIGIHHPRSKHGELYSFRTKWIAELSKFDDFDLFGMGWRWPDIRTLLWPTYIFNRNRLLQRYKGQVTSKFEAMSQYEFGLCVENMRCEGYVTEKIFDCFFAGAIPLYYGAPDIASFVPENCFIRLENFDDGASLLKALKSLSPKTKLKYRKNILNFLTSTAFNKFNDSLKHTMIYNKGNQ
jgi:hypothetical protein